MNKRRKNYSVEVSVNLSFGCHRSLLAGAARFATGCGDLEIHATAYEAALFGPMVDKRTDAALLSHLTPPDLIKRFIDSKIPICLYGSEQRRGKLRNPICQVFPDEQAIGAMAAEHFIKRGFQSLAYCHHPSWPTSRERGRAFAACLQSRGYACGWFDLQILTQANGSINQRNFSRWLKRQPRPIAILAINDAVAHYLASVIHHAGLTCPGDVALLGVDNDDLLCGCTRPPLSSIDANWEGLGYTAMRSLHALLRGHSQKDLHQTIEPKGVVTRASTDFLAVPDPDVVRAVNFIQQNVAQHISARDVLAHVHLSRPTLDKRFKHFFDQTISEYITVSRLTNAQELLAQTNLSIDKICLLSGFKYRDHLFRTFHRCLNMTPGAYRRKKTNAPRR